MYFHSISFIVKPTFKWVKRYLFGGVNLWGKSGRIIVDSIAAILSIEVKSADIIKNEILNASLMN